MLYPHGWLKCGRHEGYKNSVCTYSDTERCLESKHRDTMRVQYQGHPDEYVDVELQSMRKAPLEEEEEEDGDPVRNGHGHARELYGHDYDIKALFRDVEMEVAEFTQRRPDGYLAKCFCCVRYVTMFFLSLFLFMFMPYVLEQIRYSHTNATQLWKDGRTMLHLASFRDIPWEMWAWIHVALVRDHTGVLIWTILMYMSNGVLWYYWYTKRFFLRRKWHLCVSLLTLLLFSLLSNAINWLPPSADALHVEPRVISFVFGYIVPTAHSYFSPRVAFSVLLMHDYLKSTEKLHGCLHGLFVVLYAVLSCLYLWATRQTYSGTLILSIMAAIAAHHASRWCLLQFLRWVHRHNRRDATQKPLHSRGPMEHFTIGSDDEATEADEQEKPTVRLDSAMDTLRTPKAETGDIGATDENEFDTSTVRRADIQPDIEVEFSSMSGMDEAKEE